MHSNKPILIIFFCLLSGLLYSQNLKNSPKISNINCINDGKYAVFFYDIENASKDDKFFVDIKVSNKNASVLNTATLTGDAGLVHGGLQRKAYWNYKADNLALKDDIFINIKATPAPQIPLTSHLLKSLIFPGWGDSKLSNNKWYRALGGFSYVALASGIVFNLASIESYNAYKAETNFNKVDKLYNRTIFQKNMFYALTGAAAAVWVFDLSGIIHKRALLLKRKVPVENNYYYKKVENQSFSATSKPLFLNTYDVVKPPKLELAENSLRYEDEDGNKCLNYKESGKFVFTIKNAGDGDAINLVAEIAASKTVKGIVFPSKMALGNLPQKKEMVFEIPLTANEDIETGEVALSVNIKEANYNDMQPFQINFQSHAFIPPNVIVADHKFSMENTGKAMPGKEIVLKTIIQNIGQGTAKNIKAVFVVPPLVNENDRLDYDKEELKTNEKWEITFPFTPKYAFSDSTINIVLKLSESYGQYAQAENRMAVKMSQSLEITRFEVKPELNNTPIERASYSSDVDKDIPVTDAKYENRYALIIGNEDYSSYQTGIGKESNVDFAINDATIFKEYCAKVLGIPDRNITLLTNATTGKFKQEIEVICKLIKNTNGKAEVFFYYAGHGFPDESIGEPYLVPVDVSSSNIQNGVKLSDLYTKLTEYPSERVTVFLDACFSGGGRNKPLATLRTVKINPKESDLKGNLVVFTSSSGSESSAPYKAQYHGIFTYFLLKKIKDTGGKISYKNLSEYLLKTVQQESLIINKKEQNPEILISPDIRDKWMEWKLYP